MVISTATMSRALKRLGLPLKKSHSRLPSATSSREGALAKRGAADRPQASRLRGRMRNAHLHDTPVWEGSEG